ncbi:MAG: sensor histidine kinase [Acidimicrobiales bacterium]
MTPPNPRKPGLRPPLLHRATARQLQSIDYVIAACVIVVTEFHIHRAQSLGVPTNAALVIGLSIGAGAAIALRRRVPLFALALLTLATSVVIISGQVFFAEPFIAFPMYQVASCYERRRSLPALVAVCIVVLASDPLRFATNVGGAKATLAVVVSVTAWFVGDSVRVRRTYVAGLAEQAQQRQREIVERAQRSVAEERLQIARELHDVVAHSLSVIAVQSGVGRHVIDEHPAQAKRALAAVEETSRTALVELRRMLGVLRHDDHHPASLTPAPGISSLNQLVEQVRATGINVALNLHSCRTSDLSSTADLAIYRIVQEALTNVVKHAGPASVNVELRDERDALVLEVLDDGCASASSPRVGFDDPTHHGIVGMRERVALFEGSFLADVRTEGGFRVLARFPLVNLGSS